MFAFLLGFALVVTAVATGALSIPFETIPLTAFMAGVVLEFLL